MKLFTAIAVVAFILVATLHLPRVAAALARLVTRLNNFATNRYEKCGRVPEGLGYTVLPKLFCLKRNR